MRIILLLAAAASLAGCATIMEGTGQSVTISTDPAGAACTVDRAGTRVGQVTSTPGSLHLDKSKNDLQVSCSKGGFQTSTVSQSPKFVGTTFGNVLLGGVMGVVVDASSGANFEYPSEIRVSLAASVQPQSPDFIPARVTEPVVVTSARPEVATTRVAAVSDGYRVDGRQPSATAATEPPINVRRNFGVRADVVSESLAYAAQLDPGRGLVVLSVNPGGAAASAGLTSGDIILAFAGSPIASRADMERALAAVQPNNRVSGEVWRDHTKVMITFDF